MLRQALWAADGDPLQLLAWAAVTAAVGSVAGNATWLILCLAAKEARRRWL